MNGFWQRKSMTVDGENLIMLEKWRYWSIDKKMAIANAKLKAIEEALQEESPERINIPEIPETTAEKRTDSGYNQLHRKKIICLR